MMVAQCVRLSKQGGRRYGLMRSLVALMSRGPSVTLTDARRVALITYATAARAVRSWTG